MMRSIKGQKIVAATHNRGKLEEIAALLAPLNVEILSAKELNLPEPEETETTFVGNARIKAHAAARASNLPSLSDDSGIEIDALDGAPGVCTAEWASKDSAFLLHYGPCVARWRGCCIRRQDQRGNCLAHKGTLGSRI